jgi:hypothetical protein
MGACHFAGPGHLFSGILLALAASLAIHPEPAAGQQSAPEFGHAEVSVALGFDATFFGVPEPPDDVTPALEPVSAGLEWSLDVRWFHSTGHGFAVRGGGVEYPAIFGGWDYSLFFFEPAYAFRFGPERGEGFHVVAELAGGPTLVWSTMSWSPGPCILFCGPPEGPSVAPSTYEHFGMGGFLHAAGDLRWGIFLVGFYIDARISFPISKRNVEYDSSAGGGFRIGIAWDMTAGAPSGRDDATTTATYSPIGDSGDGHDPLGS